MKNVFIKPILTISMDSIQYVFIDFCFWCIQHHTTKHLLNNSNSHKETEPLLRGDLIFSLLAPSKGLSIYAVYI